MSKVDLTLVCIAIAAAAWLMARFSIKVYEEDQRHEPKSMDK